MKKKHIHTEAEYHAVLEALAVQSYVATGGDPIAEDHARAAVEKAAQVVREFARKEMALDEKSDDD